MISAATARRLEADYVCNFRRHFRDGLSLIHPTTKEAIKPVWSAVEQMDDELLQLGRYLNSSLPPAQQEANYPNNVRVSYWIEPKSLGAVWRKGPKHGLVIELATRSRLQRFAAAGSDDEQGHWSEVAEELKERYTLVERWSARYGTPVAYLLGLASTTGWDAKSIDRVCNHADKLLTALYLIDLIELRVYPSPATPAVDDYLALFELSFEERLVQRIEEQIRAILLTEGVASLASLQKQIGCSQGLIGAACLRLVKSSSDYRFLQEGSNRIICSS